MTHPGSQPPSDRTRGDRPSGGERSPTEVIADRLHSAAIHLLRRLRREDEASGLTASRLSALSVVVFGGPLRMGDLAEAEQVTPATISRLVAGLEAEGLVRRAPHPHDGRVLLVEATPRGRALLDAGRRRRVRVLADELEALGPDDRAALTRAASILEALTLPDKHPSQES
ncbi:MAG: MarR family transcriptional regulator [Gemmatimonadota bacterium]|jgi:DNA-binding MarR family transcriptional regulator